MRWAPLACLLLLVACGDHAQNAALRIGVFTDIPKEVEGCGDTYTFDSLDYHTGKSIFLSKLDGQSGFAVIRVNGAEEWLNWSQADSRDLSATTHLSVFKNAKYTARLKTVVETPYDEGSFNTGTLTIEGPYGRLSVKVHGETGC